jgi:hypothetical protein
LKGLGKKEQGKKLEKNYKGVNNPNYIHGKSNPSFYQLKEWKTLSKEKLLEYKTCEVCNSKVRKACHHIVPCWYLNRVGLENLKLDKNNIVVLCTKCHIKVHHFHLDLLLLPILFQLYKQDALQLKKEFLSLFVFHISQIPADQLLRLPRRLRVQSLQSYRKVHDLLSEDQITSLNLS